ncbi:MAG: hypothetical protein LUH02_09280 [Erysipelotrichaceae bacterium]|nr:hypothetical protein [Erysipelotrichaceae bacterium]
MVFTSISSVSAVYAYLKASKVTILGTIYQVKSRANYDYDTNKWTFNGESISYYSGLGTAGCGFNSKSTTTSTESNGTVMVAKRTFVCYGKNSTSTTKTGTTIIT